MDLKAIKERCEAASVGPWECDGTELRSSSGITLFSSGGGEYCSPNKADTAFLSHARTDLPALVSWVERAEDVIRTMWADIESIECLRAKTVVKMKKLLAELTDAGEG